MNAPYEYLPVAVRAWPDMRKSGKGQSFTSFPRKLLVIDTETTADPAQSLTFGSAKVAWVAFGYGDRFRIFHEPMIKDEVIFYADTLPESDPDGYETLCSYCDDRNLNLISQSQFALKYVAAMGMPKPPAKGQKQKIRWNNATMTFFNAPFDISRLAYEYGNSQGTNAGGFTFHMMPTDEIVRDLAVKHIDSKKHLTKPAVLDVRTLVWAMTNKSHSLASACRTFQLPEEYCKSHTEEHGRITPDYIDYNRKDVTATTYLACEVLRQYHEHPIPMSPVNALSPASIGKSYLDAMGVTPILDREDVPRDPILLGHAASAFYGGRAECNIRNTPVPVMLLDFQSMYSTVNALMNLWDYITAETIDAVEATADTQAFLDSMNLDTVLSRDTWPLMTGIAEIRPDGDILPVRAAYGGAEKNVTNVGDNVLYSGQPFWYAIPDLVNSKLRTGRTPTVLRAVRFIPHGKISGLQAVNLMGSVYVDPAREDFFQRVIEQRASIKSNRQGQHGDGCVCPTCRVIEQLKVISNSTSYGIYVEMLRRDTGTEISQNIYGMSDVPWEYHGTALETAQKYCYPPIGALITSGARLMLGILETLITEYGGTGAFRDTDSTAVVASTDGGFIPCPGGSYKLDGRPAIKVLSGPEVEVIRERINTLNPYQGAAGKSILKNEAICWAYVISAKRYCLFTYDQDGRPIVPPEIDGKRAFMEHGLGLYLNPDNIESPGQDWMRQLWQVIVSQAHGLDIELPAWIDKPALTRSAVTSPHLMRWFDDYNDGQPYVSCVKPFGFMLLCSEYNPIGAFTGEGEQRFVAPYSANPDDWTTMEWRDLHDPDATGTILGRDFQVKTFRHVLREYTMNPEIKSLAPDGLPCGPRTTGLLSRRIVRAKQVKHIGKESNKLEQVTNGMLDDWDDVITDYGEPAIVTPARVLFSQPGITATWIAEQINSHTDVVRCRIADGTPYTHADTRKIVTVTPAMIRDWLHGRRATPDLNRIVNEMAARIVRPVTGIPESQITWSGSASVNKYAPDVLLAEWMGMGYPSPADGTPLAVPDVKRLPLRPTRICSRAQCSNPVTRPNQIYCSVKCKRLVQKRRARVRAKELAA